MRYGVSFPACSKAECRGLTESNYIHVGLYLVAFSRTGAE